LVCTDEQCVFIQQHKDYGCECKSTGITKSRVVTCVAEERYMYWTFVGYSEIKMPNGTPIRRWENKIEVELT